MKDKAFPSGKKTDYILFAIDDREHCLEIDQVIYSGTLFRPEHKWANYDAYKGEFPNKEELEGVKGIIFPGARFSAYEDLPWIHQL